MFYCVYGQMSEIKNYYYYYYYYAPLYACHGGVCVCLCVQYTY